MAKQRCSRREKEQDAINRKEETLKRRLHDEAWWPLIFLPIGVLFLNFFPLIRTFHNYANPNNPSYTLWILNAIFAPLQGGYIALVYVLDSGTLKQLTYRNIRAAITGRETVAEYPTGSGEMTESVHELKHMSYRYQQTDTVQKNSNL